ncbi:DUF4913 domain-containing protein [Agreia pratensis]|uniref:DUF4913 domain-containing protein n=1 Tax=Agreia pratensis TaxID=150121 RepID=UPI00188BFC84|nr:DUF4913 domain-containing protein [Agreia pratensis]MBF4636239.1 DUF4913 domain-containing protein [Agreia pratensis]
MTDEYDIPAAVDDSPQLETFYQNVVEFVDEWLLPRYARNPQTHSWDPRWFEYVEVVDRLEALWRSWEFLRLEGMTGMAVFFRDYFDPAMAQIASKDGPFWNMTSLQGRQVPEPWPSDKPDSEFYASL